VLGFAQPLVSDANLKSIRAKNFSARYADTALSLLDQPAPLPFDLFVRMLFFHHGTTWPEFWATTWAPIQKTHNGWILSDGERLTCDTRHLNWFWHIHIWGSRKLEAEAHPSWLRQLLSQPNGQVISVEDFVYLSLRDSPNKSPVQRSMARAALAAAICVDAIDAKNIFNRQAVEGTMAAAQARLGISPPPEISPRHIESSRPSRHTKSATAT
jgi:hypothetical protein